MKNDIKEIFSLFVIVLMLFIPIETANALSINTVTVQASDRYALVKWQTDQDATSSVSFGTNITKLTQTRSDTILTKNHMMLMSLLKNNTKYYFNVTSSNSTKSLTKGIFNVTTTKKDTIPPFLNVTLPSYLGSATLDVNGLTEPGTQVYVYVNGNLSGAGFQKTGANGVISLPGIVLKASSSGKTTSNTVKITAIDPSGLKTEVTKTVVVDKTPPAVTFNSPQVLVDAANSDKTFGWGEKSMTIKGNSDEPARIDIYLDNTLVKTVNASSPWQTTITFGDDKQYALRFQAEDRAGNVFREDFTAVVDTQPMGTMTTNLDDLSPSYVVRRIVQGKTKPGATVIVFVNNRTTSSAQQYLPAAQAGAGEFHLSTQGARNFPASIRELIGRNLVISAAQGIQRTAPLNYVTTADDQGNFKVEIALETTFTASTEQAKSFGVEVGDAWKNDVLVYAFDTVGRNATVKKPIIYTRCGAGTGIAGFSVSSPTPSPTSIPEPVLQQGVGQFSLTMDIDWHGPTPQDTVEFQRAPQIFVQPGISRYDAVHRYNLTLGQGQKFKIGAVYPPRPLSPDDKQIYAIVTIDKIAHDFGKSSQFKDELQFPLMLELQYTYLKPNGDRSDLITQRKCIDVNLQVEPAVTDFWNPNRFLNVTTHAIDKITNYIEQKLLPPVRQLQTNLIYWCAGSIVLDFAFDLFLTKPICIFNRVPGGDIRRVLNAPETGCTYALDDNGQMKFTCYGKNGPGYQVCGDWVSRETNYDVFIRRPICDRLFCPSVPSLAKHSQSFNDLVVKSAPRQQLPVPSSTGFGGFPVATTGNNAPTLCVRSVGPAQGGGFFGFSYPPGTTDCEKEFQRAWGAVIPFDFPYKDEYDIAYRVYALQQPANGGLADTGILNGLLRGGSFIDNICTASPPKVQFVQIGDTVYRIYQTEQPTNIPPGVPVVTSTPQNSLWVVDVGRKVTVAQGTTLAELEKVGEGIRFDPRFIDIKFIRSGPDSGLCAPGADGLDCRRAVWGGDNPPAQVKVPPEVTNKVATLPTKDFVYNPTGSIITATQSLCIPAVNGYLTAYDGLLTHVNACFKTILKTGKGNSGTCQALLSSVVCDFVIDALSCVGKLTKTAGEGWGALGDFADRINPFKSVSSAAESITERISSEYGETAGFQALFDENKLVHSICIGAFTGDWDVEGIGNLLTTATIPPVKSTCVAFPASRRFITSNPLRQGRPTYLYYAGGMLAAGADISTFSVQLVCSADNTCAGNPNNQCDCAGHSHEEVQQVLTNANALKRGDVWDQAQYITVNDGDYRYDKLRITYSYKDSNGRDVTDKCNAALTEEGAPPSTCSFGASGFRCEFKVGDQGTARFVDGPRATTENGQEKIYTVGQPLALYTKTEVNSPDATNPIRKWVRYVIKNQDGVVVYSGTDAFQLDEGTHEWSFPGENLQITTNAFSSGNVQDNYDIKYDAGSSITIVPGSKQATATGSVSFVVTFVKDTNKYVCNDLVDTPKGPAISSSHRSDAKDLPTINCGNVGFMLDDQTVKSGIHGGTLSSSDVLVSDYKGSYIIVKFTKGTTSTPTCPSEPVTWTGRATLYNSIDTPSGPQASVSRVFTDGAYQEKDFSFKVLCNQLGGLKSAQEAGATVITFNLNPPTTVKLGTSLDVQYDVQSPTPITKFNVDVLDAKTGDQQQSLTLLTEADLKNQNKNILVGTSSVPIANLVPNKYQLQIEINGNKVGPKKDLIVN